MNSSSGLHTTTTTSALNSVLGNLPSSTPGIHHHHSGTTHTTGHESAATEIDRIMAKIEQDNKILAELDKSRSTIGKTFTFVFIIW